MQIGWIAVHLSLVVPERFAAKQFADSSFDVQAHVSTPVAKAGGRLARVQDILPAILAH